jgi:type I restriction enzyme, S subunit
VKAPIEFNALGQLPHGWTWQPLQMLTANPKQDVVDGPFGSDLKASEYVARGVPIARLQNIDRNAFVTKNIRFLTPEKAKDLSRHEFRPNDILITKLGDPLGKACVVPASIGSGVIVADLVRVRPDESRVDRQYLTYAINSPTIIKQFELHTKGTTRPRVNLSVLRQLPIPVAPREVQGKIVAELEKQFSRLDEAVANLQRVKANLKRYKASVLKAAVEGRLVETEASLARREGRTYETGEQLLQQMVEARRGLKKLRAKNVGSFDDDSAAQSELPAGWKLASIDEIGHVQLGRQRSPKNRSKEFPVKYIRAANITASGLDLRDVLDMEFSTDEVERYRLRAGDIVLSEASGSPEHVGKPAVWQEQMPICCFQNTVIRLRPVLPMSAFLLVCFQSYYVNGVFARIAGGVGINHLSAEKFSRLKVPLPPLVEQARIVVEVDRHLSIVREVESEVDANLLRAQALRQATLARSFAGCL